MKDTNGRLDGGMMGVCYSVRKNCKVKKKEQDFCLNRQDWRLSRCNIGRKQDT